MTIKSLTEAALRGQAGAPTLLGPEDREHIGAFQVGAAISDTCKISTPIESVVFGRGQYGVTLSDGRMIAAEFRQGGSALDLYLLK
ncbi:hypothetical protein C0V97_12520 [Asaia sp. W19]|uniref:hypothetical protein n=1 Tax=unclassified Asaia TaxID=2685023 RepID=UPI000F8E0A8A|nr:hypothetical protein [Asaia sp. W19]RUT25400.1 hypothetical protein C0V97_12520 [Asaia sp. W19]